MHIRRTAKKSFIKKLSWIHGKVFLASCESNSIRIRLSVTISHTSIEVICQSIRYIWHLWKKKLITFFATFSASRARKTLETSYSPPILVIRDRSKDLFLLLQQVFEIKNASVSTSDHCLLLLQMVGAFCSFWSWSRTPKGIANHILGYDFGYIYICTCNTLPLRHPVWNSPQKSHFRTKNQS